MVGWIITSSVLIAAIIALRYILKGKISLRLQYALWALVLLRLLVPVSFGRSAISIMNPIRDNLPDAVISFGVPDREDNSSKDVAPSAFPVMPKDPIEAASNSDTIYTVAEADTNKVKDWGSFVITVWLVGVAVIGLGLLITNLHFSAKLKKLRRPLAVDGSKLPVYITDAIDTPCLYGLLHPAIYVTPVIDNDIKLQHVLTHETIHYHQGDHVWSLLRCVCIALHWYNPLVWWAAILSRRDAELACDESTIRQIGEDQQEEYERTLIRMTCQKCPNPLMTATIMTGSIRSIEERILLIVEKPKMTVYTLITAILIVAVAAGCTLTGAKEIKGPWEWTMGLTVDEISSANVWNNFGTSELTDEAVDTLASLLSNLEKADFEENKKLVGGTPEYGLHIETSDGTYVISESIASGPLEMTYEGRLWWIYSDELAQFIKGLLPENNDEDDEEDAEKYVEVQIEVAVDIEAPEAVIVYAKSYVQMIIETLNDVNATKNREDSFINKIAKARIIGLTHIGTGTDGITSGEQLWLLEYRLLPEMADSIELVGGMQMELIDGENWLTEHGSAGQPYLLLHWEDNDGLTSWERICVTNTDVINFDYSASEMLEQYGNMYTAATMELYKTYLKTYYMNGVSIVLEPGFSESEDGYPCFKKDDVDHIVLVAIHLTDKDKLTDRTPADREVEFKSLPKNEYGDRFVEYTLEGEYHYNVFREFDAGIVVVELCCMEPDKEEYISIFPKWASTAAPSLRLNTKQ